MGSRFNYTWEVVKDYVQKKWRLMLIIAGVCYAISFYISSLLTQNMATLGTSLERVHYLNPIFIFSYGFSPAGLMLFLFLGTAASLFFIYRKILIDMQELSMDERGFEISQTGTYGTARQMSTPERVTILEEKELKDARNNILGRLPGKQTVLSIKGGFDNKAVGPHMFVLGCSNSRKTSNLFNPMVMQCMLRGESIIVTDPKGELRNNFYKLALKYGYTVKEINTIRPIVSDSCNFMDYVESYNDARTLTDIVMANTSGDGFHKEDFWAKGERSAICTGILYVKEADEYKGRRNLQSVYDFLIHNELDAINDKIDAIEDEHSFAKRQWDIFKTTPENSQGGIITGVATRLDILNDDVIGAMTGFSEIDLTLPGKQKCMYFVVISDHDRSNRIISSLYFSYQIGKLIDYADMQYSQCCDVPINFILDEMPSVGHINMFSEYMSVARSRGLRFILCAQNLGQLMDMYPGNLWTNIIGNCDTMVVLGVNDSQITAPYVSKKSGEMTIRQESTKESVKRLHIWNFSPIVQKSSGDGRRMVYTPSEVEQLPLDQALLFIRGHNVLKVEKFPYFAHPMYEEIEFENYILHEPNWWKIITKQAKTKEDIQWFQKEYDRLKADKEHILKQAEKEKLKENKVANQFKKEREEIEEEAQIDLDELSYTEYLLYMVKHVKTYLIAFKDKINGDNTWSFGQVKSDLKRIEEELKKERVYEDEIEEDHSYLNGGELVSESDTSYNESYLDVEDDKLSNKRTEDEEPVKSKESEHQNNASQTPSVSSEPKKKRETVAERIARDFDDNESDDIEEDKPLHIDGKQKATFAASVGNTQEYIENTQSNFETEFEEVEVGEDIDTPYDLEEDDFNPEDEILEKELEQSEEVEVQSTEAANSPVDSLQKQFEELSRREEERKKIFEKAKQKTTKGL